MLLVHALQRLLHKLVQFLNNVLLKLILPLLLYKLDQPSTTLKLVQFFNNIPPRLILHAMLYKLAQFFNNYEKEMLLENQRELERPRIARNTLQMI